MMQHWTERNGKEIAIKVFGHENHSFPISTTLPYQNPDCVIPKSKTEFIQHFVYSRFPFELSSCNLKYQFATVKFCYNGIFKLKLNKNF